MRSNLASPQQWLLAALNGGTESKSGAAVTANNSLQLAAVFSCISLIAETIAMLPCVLYKSMEKGKEKADSKLLYSILRNLPNPETTAFEFWVMYVVNLLLTGDAFAIIKRDENGQILQIWNVPSKNVTIYRNKVTKELFYEIKDGEGNKGTYYPEEIVHTRGLRFDNLDKSLNPIILARDALGLAQAQEEYASKYFANGAQVGGIVKYPQKLSETAFQRFKEDFNREYSSVVNSNKTIFLEDGADFVQVTNNPKDSQALDSRKFQVIEICRFFRVPPHMIFDLDRATFSNIESQYVGYVTYCINPITAKIEQTIYRDLLTLQEKKKHFAKFLTNALLRGDIKTRKEFYQAGIQNGWFSPNDVRELEDLNAYDGGDIYMVNGNMIPVNKLEEFILKKGGYKNNGQGNKDANVGGGTAGE